MGFNRLDDLLNSLQAQGSWEKEDGFLHLLKLWESLLDPKILAHTRHQYISRQVLWIATSSAAWAQTLSLQRYQLLKKLNAQLSTPLVDLKFSTAQWHKPHSIEPILAQEAHPSHVKREKSFSSLPPGNTPKKAFDRWAQIIKLRSQSLPPCPQCQSPTPPGELQRWQVCAHCMAKTKSSLT